MAGGFARRMWPLTLNTPKQLLPLGDGYVVLDLVVDGLLGMDLEEILLSVNARFSDAFREWARSRGLDVHLVEEPSRSEEEKPGAVGYGVHRRVLRDHRLQVGHPGLYGQNHPPELGLVAVFPP